MDRYLNVHLVDGTTVRDDTPLPDEATVSDLADVANCLGWLSSPTFRRVYPSAQIKGRPCAIPATAILYLEEVNE